MNVCKSICYRFSRKPVLINRYESNRRCKKCGIYVDLDMLKCGCCGHKTSGRSRYTKYNGSSVGVRISGGDESE